MTHLLAEWDPGRQTRLEEAVERPIKGKHKKECASTASNKYINTPQRIQYKKNNLTEITVIAI